MKNRIVFLFFALFLAWQSCDKIDSPYVRATGGGAPGDTNDVVLKTILIEEFTGQRCPNCPEMAERIKTIKATYGDQIVVVAIHAGFFAIPLGSTFSTDYRTPAGNELDEFFVGLAGYPKGLVNRTGFSGDTLLLETDELSGRVAFLIEQEPVMGVRINNTYDPGSRDVNIEVSVNVLEYMERNLMLSVFITEDSIVSPQQDKTVTIHDYVHQHILRTAVNGTWGDPLNDSPALEPGTSFTKNYQATLAGNWNDQHCSVVAFVHDSETYEVLQAVEVKVR